MKQESFKTTDDKIDIREKIISKIQEGDNVLLLESPELSAIKEIEKQGIKPNKIIIPNNKEFKKIKEALKNYKTDLNIELINTSALQYLVDSEEKFDFIWLDYCGAFSYYIKDLDILFAKKLDKNSDVLLLTKESINEVVIFERIKFKLNGSKSEKKGLDILQKIFNKIRIYSTKERFEFTKRIGLEIHKKEKNEVIGVLENISKELNL